MATVRVCVLTYRRPHLLPRAVESLRRQTFADWVCELHDDDPAGTAAQRLVEELADPRIVLRRHERNLGPAAPFNLAFRAAREPFFTLLEDDNWWESDFLSRMLAALEAHPSVDVAWANMRVWREEADGSWTDTRRLVWDAAPDGAPRLVHWPHPRQLFGSLHGNGALLVRSRPRQTFVIPDMEAGGCEIVRERSFPFPMLFLPRPLGNFGVTRETGRSRDPADWVSLQTLTVGTFLRHVAADGDALRSLWRYCGDKQPRSTAALFFAALAIPGCRSLLRHARLDDVLFSLAYAARRPSVALASLLVRRRHAEVWRFLDRHTRARSDEARRRGRPPRLASDLERVLAERELREES